MKIKRLGLPETRIEIDLANIGATVGEFQAISEDPGKFAAFVTARSELSEQTNGLQGDFLHKNQATPN